MAVSSNVITLLLTLSSLTFSFDSDVCTKYQEAAKIVNLALEGLVSQCIVGAKIMDLCEFGHSVISTQAAKLFTKKVNGQVIDRGVAFPVCISVNDVVCNHSPLPTEERVSTTFYTSFYYSRNLSWSTQVRHDCMPLEKREREPLFL